MTTALMLLRIGIGVVFLWFGLLKLFNVSPVTDLVMGTTPGFIANLPYFYTLLSIFEIMVGLGFIIGKFIKIFAILMIGHLILATAFVLFTKGFSPGFPILTLEGEFVMKNIVIILAGLIYFSNDAAGVTDS